MGFEINSASGGGFFPLPMILEVVSSRLNHNEVKILTVKGSYFTFGTSVGVTGLTIHSVNVISDHIIEVEVEANTADAFYDLVITNETGTTTMAGAIEVKLSTWLDLRAGGNTFTSGNAAGKDIRFKTGMALSRDTQGMFFTGVSPWSSWVKFESEAWNRGDNKTLQWVFSRPTSNMMIGIGSNATDENNTAQYAQAEIEAYLNSSTSFWGVYGNNGQIGSAGNQSNGITINQPFFKIKFENDGGVGSTFTLYSLPSGDSADWDDESTVLSTFTVGGSLNPDENVIMPFIAPQNGGTQRFIALKIE